MLQDFLRVGEEPQKSSQRTSLSLPACLTELLTLNPAFPQVWCTNTQGTLGGVPDVKTICITILRLYLPFSLFSTFVLMVQKQGKVKLRAT